MALAACVYSGVTCLIANQLADLLDDGLADLEGTLGIV
jgi:hypothetical protein